MLEDIATVNPVVLAVFGTLFTWFATALGAACVYLVPKNYSASSERKILDASLGFSAGVMLSASFWSLLLPAIEVAAETMPPGLEFFPAILGFLVGCGVVQLSEKFLPDSEDFSFLVENGKKVETLSPASSETDSDDGKVDIINSGLRLRKKTTPKLITNKVDVVLDAAKDKVSSQRLLLLIIAMTIHNFPEGLAVGVAFGSIASGKSTFSQALVLTIAMALQNFPEGLAVSLPLQKQTGNKHSAFFWGQLSGSVEILGGLIGAYLVETTTQLLPYSLGFAAGAMIFVVVDSVIPESQSRGNKIYATWGAIIGFVIMTVLDVSLG